MLGATPGSEHLSALREGYLRLLAGEQGMAFLRLQPGQGLEAALTSPAMAKPVAVRTGGRYVLAGLGFCLLLACYAAPWLRKTRVLKK
jgi:mxaL protein